MTPPTNAPSAGLDSARGDDKRQTAVREDSKRIEARIVDRVSTTAGERLTPRLKQIDPKAVRMRHASAMAAIEIFSPGIFAGSFAPCRAGGFDGNH